MITATVLYFALLALSAALTYVGCIPAAIVLGAAALGVAWRYEIRWVVDHTRLTRHAPRKVPATPSRLPRAHG